MEGGNGINFPNMEKHSELEWLFFEEQLQRSLEVPLLPKIPQEVDFIKCENLQTNLVDLQQNPENNPSIFSPQPSKNEWIFQSLDQNLEADFHLWSEYPSLCVEDHPWKLPINDPQVISNPNSNPLFDDDDDQFLINHRNHNNNLNDLINFNDQTLDAVVEEGLKKRSSEEGSVISENEGELIKTNDSHNNNQKVSKMEMLKYEEIKKYFEMPISKAAKELKVGLTVLKKRCRELNIKRWPHRKIKSLKALISNVKEMGMAEVAEALEEHRKKLQVVPEMELSEETKKLRQACFKANYKKRRAMALLTHY